MARPLTGGNLGDLDTTGKWYISGKNSIGENAWSRVEATGTGSVTTVGGKPPVAGNVPLDTGDIAEVTDKRYLTDAGLAAIASSAVADVASAAHEADGAIHTDGAEKIANAAHRTDLTIHTTSTEKADNAMHRTNSGIHVPDWTALGDGSYVLQMAAGVLTLVVDTATIIQGTYTGSAATFAALPTTRFDAKALVNGDISVLNADDGGNLRGFYRWNGAVWGLEIQIANPLAVTQVLAEAGADTGLWLWSPERVKQAIEAIRPDITVDTQVEAQALPAMAPGTVLQVGQDGNILGIYRNTSASPKAFPDSTWMPLYTRMGGFERGEAGQQVAGTRNIFYADETVGPEPPASLSDIYWTGIVQATRAAYDGTQLVRWQKFISIEYPSAGNYVWAEDDRPSTEEVLPSWSTNGPTPPGTGWASGDEAIWIAPLNALTAGVNIGDPYIMQANLARPAGITGDATEFDNSWTLIGPGKANGNVTRKELGGIVSLDFFDLDGNRERSRHFIAAGDIVGFQKNDDPAIIFLYNGIGARCVRTDNGVISSQFDITGPAWLTRMLSGTASHIVVEPAEAAPDLPDASAAWQSLHDYIGVDNVPFSAQVGITGVVDINGVALTQGTTYNAFYPTDQTSGGSLDLAEFAKIELIGEVASSSAEGEFIFQDDGTVQAGVFTAGHTLTPDYTGRKEPLLYSRFLNLSGSASVVTFAARIDPDGLVRRHRIWVNNNTNQQVTLQFADGVADPVHGYLNYNNSGVPAPDIVMQAGDKTLLIELVWWNQGCYVRQLVDVSPPPVADQVITANGGAMTFSGGAANVTVKQGVGQTVVVDLTPGMQLDTASLDSGVAEASVPRAGEIYIETDAGSTDITVTEKAAPTSAFNLAVFSCVPERINANLLSTAGLSQNGRAIFNSAPTQYNLYDPQSLLQANGYELVIPLSGHYRADLGFRAGNVRLLEMGVFLDDVELSHLDAPFISGPVGKIMTVSSTTGSLIFYATAGQILDVRQIAGSGDISNFSFTLEQLPDEVSVVLAGTVVSNAVPLTANAGANTIIGVAHEGQWARIQLEVTPGQWINGAPTIDVGSITLIDQRAGFVDVFIPLGGGAADITYAQVVAVDTDYMLGDDVEFLIPNKLWGGKQVYGRSFDRLINKVGAGSYQILAAGIADELMGGGGRTANNWIGNGILMGSADADNNAVAVYQGSPSAAVNFYFQGGSSNRPFKFWIEYTKI